MTNRVSDARLNKLIDWYSLFSDSEDHEVGIYAALLELRDRRRAEKAPCPEHAKMIAEPAQWADFQCPKCGSYSVAQDRFEFRCVAVDCGWTRDLPADGA